MILTFIGLLREQRELEEYHPQLVGELLRGALLGVIGTGTLVRYLSRICGTFPYDSVVPVPMIRVFIHCHIVFSINYSAKVQRIFVLSK